jgi:ferredoxin
MTNSRLHIDWTTCRAHGLCTELLPELLTRDPWGYPLPHEDLTIPDALAAHARRAVALCPRLALRLDEPTP